jgi:hypothetical protein
VSDDPTATAVGSFTVYVGAVDQPLFCNHDDGDVSVRVTAGDCHVWLHGTPDQLHGFAHQLHRLANQAATTSVRAPHGDVDDAPIELPKVDEDEDAA